MAEDYKPGQLPYPEQDERKKFCKFHYKGVLLLLLPILLGPILLGPEVLAYRMLYLGTVVYLYYILNLMSQLAVAFILVVFVPVCGISASKVICTSYYSDLMFVTLGSIFMGVMMDVSKLSERLGMMVIGCVGSNLRLLQVFLMFMTAITSFFVSSTFMAAFWMKIAQAVILEYTAAGILVAESEEETYERQAKPYPSDPVIGIYLTVAYSATLGAMISPFQDPNGEIYATLKPFMSVHPAGFLLLYAAPLIFGFIVIALWINMIFLGLFWGKTKDVVRDVAQSKEGIQQAIANKKDNMGPWTIHSIFTLLLIIITAILLFTRLPLLWSGWDDHVPIVKCGASVPIILMSLFFFAVPANYMFCRYYCCRQPQKEGTAPALVGWKIVNANTPWSHLFMMGAGGAFLRGYKDSKLMDLVNQTIARQGYRSTSCAVLASLLGTLLTSIAPATFVANIVLGSMVPLGIQMGVGKRGLAVPFAASVHNQFLLPVSTTSNTLISGWGNIRPYQFLLGGIVPALSMFIFLGVFSALLGSTAYK
ncbi:protein I'm not dead yet [Drosophila novamexicana]|uniref:protein I'm not dead yet n=1 Tax=Drosophila novamexicana TaxID=47314 RepID=UPI0011E5D605|nr:protein I'm not dead yet [Drosophila novamexicana]